MLGFHPLGFRPLGIFTLGPQISPEEADFEWPFDNLKPRHIGIHPVAATIGGGIALTRKEPTVDSGAGFWRIVLGGIPVKTRTNILIWRGLECALEGRGKTIAIPLYDGKRAPWVTVGGTIDAESFSDVPVGATQIRIVPTTIGEIEAGMHFSVNHRAYRIKSVDAQSGVYDCTIWPKVREAFLAGQALEFRRPVCMMRLAQDDGMALTLDGLKRGEATVEFVEAL